VKLHPGSQLFQTHDRSAAGPIFRVCERPAHPPALPQRAGADGVGVTRHPPDTALDPQSGIAYFIRIEEGLQDKAISLKSVATGPSKHTWKMAWGRKTHLKKWGVLYKSYRCRHMYQPKCAPPPYRMQIYVLEEHDRDAARGEAPTPGIALVQILSLQDAPLRRRAGVKRELEENAEELLPTQTPAGTPGALAGAAHGAAAFPTGSGGRAVMTPVGATPLPPPHGSSAVGRRAPSVGATPLSAVAVRLDGRFTGALGPPLEPVSAPRACEVGDAGGREAVHRAAADVWVQGAPGAGARALGANPLDALEWESAAAEGSAAGKGARGGAAGAALLREAREAQAAAVAALPLHSVALAERYGGLAAPILAGMLVGSPWGLPCTCELLSGARISRPGVGGGCIPPPERVRFDAAPRELDLTALGSPPSPPSTKRTRLVPTHVLNGHAASTLQVGQVDCALRRGGGCASVGARGAAGAGAAFAAAVRWRLSPRSTNGHGALALLFRLNTHECDRGGLRWIQSFWG